MFTISSKNDVLQRRIEIKTFVFFDLETTGFIQGTIMPKITEMSLVATSRDSLLTKDGHIPRFMHKLTIPLQPSKLIPLIVSQITGLYNDLLEYEKPFDDHLYELLNTFISKLCPPVCFVAHNGDQFDYPILLSELKRIGKTLSEDILCIDSLVAFRTLFSHVDSKAGDEINLPKRAKEDFNIVDDGLDEQLAAIVDLHSISTTSVETDGIEITGEKSEMDPKSMQKVNETTPTHQINLTMNMKQYGVRPVKKRLPFTCSRPRNLKLDTIYEHFVGVAPLNSHSAENDCLSLLICVMKMGDAFICWADHNASPLRNMAINKK